MKYGNRSVWRRFISSPISLVVLVIALVVLIRASSNIHDKARLSATKLEQAQNSLNTLVDHQRDIAAKVDYLSTDQGIEAEMRTRYHAVKEGESVAVIVDDHQTAAVALASSTTQGTTTLSWFGRLLRGIGF